MWGVGHAVIHRRTLVLRWPQYHQPVPSLSAQPISRAYKDLTCHKQDVDVLCGFCAVSEVVSDPNILFRRAFRLEMSLRAPEGLRQECEGRVGPEGGSWLL